MRQLLLIVVTAIVASQCVVTKPDTLSHDHVGTVALPQLGGHEYFLPMRHVNEVTKCLSTYEFYKVRNDSLTRQVIHRSIDPSIASELNESINVDIKVGINPKGQVILSRVISYDNPGHKEVADRLAINVLNYRYQPHYDAPCVQFGKYTVAIDIDALIR